MEKRQLSPAQQAENKAFFVIGLFLGIFGLTVLLAIYFTPTVKGQITNLISGLLLVLIAVLAGLKSKFWIKQ